MTQPLIRRVTSRDVQSWRTQLKAGETPCEFGHLASRLDPTDEAAFRRQLDNALIVLRVDDMKDEGACAVCGCPTTSVHKNGGVYQCPDCDAEAFIKDAPPDTVPLV